MFVEKEKNLVGSIYAFKKQENYIVAVRAFRRKINGEDIVFVSGLEQVSDDDKELFVNSIKLEVGNGEIRKAQAKYLALDNETWFDIVQRKRKNSVVPFGEYVAVSPDKKDIASLHYVGRRALISGDTELLVSVSNSPDAPESVYDQLMKTFVDGVAAEVNKSEKRSSGVSIFFTVEDYNKQSQELMKRVEDSPKTYSCKRSGYMGQHEEDYSESVYRIDTVPAALEEKKDKFEQFVA